MAHIDRFSCIAASLPQTGIGSQIPVVGMRLLPAK
jgi:hypothetical protein